MFKDVRPESIQSDFTPLSVMLSHELRSSDVRAESAPSDATPLSVILPRSLKFREVRAGNAPPSDATSLSVITLPCQALRSRDVLVENASDGVTSVLLFSGMSSSTSSSVSMSFSGGASEYFFAELLFLFIFIFHRLGLLALLCFLVLRFLLPFQYPLVRIFRLRGLFVSDLPSLPT